MREPSLFLPLLAEDLARDEQAPMRALLEELRARAVEVRNVPGAPVSLSASFEVWSRLGDSAGGLGDASLSLLESCFPALRAVLVLGERANRVYVGAASIAYAPGDAWPTLAGSPLLAGPSLAHLVAAVAEANDAPSSESHARMLAAYDRHQRWQAT
jgi:hypothetical protein